MSCFLGKVETKVSILSQKTLLSMPRRKSSKYSHNTGNPFVVQPLHILYETIKWQRQSSYFANQNPIVLELACGRWEYTLGMARHYPWNNYVGVDIKWERIHTGASLAQKEWLPNVGFLRAIIQNLADYFDENEIQDMWIVHPDPRPKNSDEKRRLTHERFLKIYEDILRPNSLLRLKTDDEELYQYSLWSLKKRGRALVDATQDLYSSKLLDDHQGIRTKYEDMFVKRGKTIKYAKRISPKK